MTEATIKPNHNHKHNLNNRCNN